MKIAILLTCYNRKAKTVRCLKSVLESHHKANTNVEYDIYLTDDGSTDGTAEAVRSIDGICNITILKGDGNLFWNGGMNHSWDYASSHGSYDGYLWLNDDSVVYPDFWVDLPITDSFCKEKYGVGGIYVGSTCDPETKDFTYGGFIYVSKVSLKDKFVLPCGAKPLECECAHGNITYVSSDVEKRLGHLYRKYKHGGGDHDYTYTAFKNKMPVLVMPHYAGECENDHLGNSKSDFENLSFRKRWAYLFSPLGYNLHNTLLFQRRCFPYRYPFVLLAGLLRAFFPSIHRKIYLYLRK